MHGFYSKKGTKCDSGWLCKHVQLLLTNNIITGQC